ncbi:MAG: hypothetical protein JXQ71_14525 [Verrucomicrobia bacterium]|nr:hypothetical protein [Verrucomicrobiota bacterium]
MPPDPDPPRPSPARQPPAGSAFDRQVSRARHDLRNPLAHILGFTEMLIEKTGAQGLNFLKSRLQVIERSARQLTDAVNTELDPERVAAGPVHVARLQERIERVCARIIEIAGRLRQKPVVRADAAFDDDLGRIMGAAQRLRDMCGPTLAFLREKNGVSP